MAVNPNWPTIEDAWGAAWNANGGAVPATKYVDVTSRALHQSSTKRGRQYELDQVQAGEYQTTLDNLDGALDPTNTAGPWAGNIKPYQPFRKRAQWPPTANLLTAVQASGGDGYTGGLIPASFGFTFGAFQASIAVLGSGVAFQGLNAFSFAVTSGAPINSGIFLTDTPAATPGKSYTFSLYVANKTAATSVTVLPYIVWLTANGSTWGNGTSVVLAGAATPAWQRITVTATAPASCYGMRVGMNLGAATTAASTVVIDGLQLEKSSAASAYTTPGTWYPLYAGFVERLPSTWSQGGTYGEVQPTAVDAFALLSQQQLSDPLTEEINSRKPRFLYRLSDPQGSTSATDSTGNNPAALIVKSKYGSGSYGFGQAITAANTTTGVYVGSADTVLTLTNPTPGQPVNAAASVLSLSDVGIKGPSTAAYTRMIAFRYTAGLPSVYVDVWTQLDTRQGQIPFDMMRLYLDNKGALTWSINTVGNANVLTYTDAVANYADGNWHLAVFGYDAVANVAMLSVDGRTSTRSTSTLGNFTTTQIVADAVGAALDVGNGYAASNTFKGDLAFVAEFSSLLSTPDVATLYSAWRSACAGESTGARYARILRYSGYSGASNIATGRTSSMGPATDISGTDVVSALQAVVDTESGAHFVAADGTITFRGRDVRYNALTPSATFGEGAGEFPYEDCQLDYDSTHLANFATITQTSTGQTFTATDATAAANYFPRTFQRSINSTDPLECQDAANYLVSRYKNPLTRVTALKLHPSAYPALWPVVLGLELGARIRVMRRPFGAPAIQLDLFVENIAFDFDDNGEASVTLQCSPIDATPYLTLAAWHATLVTGPNAGGWNAGTSSVTINAPQDNVNPLAAQIAVGQQLALSPNTFQAETVTVSGVGATSPGWTTATITFASPTTHYHPQGDYVSDALPTGTTDPATWDGVSKFDAAALTY